MLASNPSRVEVLERMEETRAGELRRPDVIEHRDVGCLALGNRARDHAMVNVAGGPHDLHVSSVGSVADELLPRPVCRNHHAQPGIPANAAEPLRVDE